MYLWTMFLPNMLVANVIRYIWKVEVMKPSWDLSKNCIGKFWNCKSMSHPRSSFNWNMTTENANIAKMPRKILVFIFKGVFVNFYNFHLISSLLWSQDSSLNTWLGKSIWSVKENLLSIWTVRLQSPQICPVLIWNKNPKRNQNNTSKLKIQPFYYLKFCFLCTEQNTTLLCVTSCSRIFAWNGVCPTVYIN